MTVLLAVMITVLFIPTTAVTVYAASVADTITYTTDEGEEVDFKGSKFNDVCEDLTDEELDYIEFTSLPSSSKGTLYYDYDDDKEEIEEDEEYYYSGSPSISDITFVPDDDYSGTFTISYSGRDEDGNKFTGSVKITVDDNGSDSDGDIEYSVDADDTVTFNKSHFNSYCKSENDGATLDYLYFEQPSSSKGTLYYDYDDDKEKLDEDDEYYYGKSPYISDITFVPDDDFAGDCEIGFKGYDVDADTIVGTVLISVANDDLDEADDIAYSVTAGSSVTFDDDDFNEVCEDLTDEELDYVKFTLPTSTKGTLYYGYNSSGSNTKISASTKYYYDEKPYVRSVSFVPSGDSSGTVTIKYTGFNSEGSAFSGEINVAVKAKTVSPNTASQYFSDVNSNYSWAVLYVDGLYSTGVLTGTNNSNGTKSFNPSNNITRGDFMLILSRALNLTSSSSTKGFSDVPSGSYYYEAITAAKALGIAKGTDNKFHPTATITREDALVLALRAMSVSGTGYVAGDTSTLSAFYDKNMISDYAKDAIATLIKTGIITGSNNQIHPKDNITRAEAAAVIYRIKF